MELESLDWAIIIGYLFLSIGIGVFVVKHNSKNITGKGSCIFIHLTKNYNPTAGCIALEKKNFLILLKLINSQTKVLIK